MNQYFWLLPPLQVYCLIWAPAHSDWLVTSAHLEELRAISVLYVALVPVTVPAVVSTVTSGDQDMDIVVELGNVNGSHT